MFRTIPLPEEVTMYCPQCGAANNDAAVFCASCGVPLTQSSPAAVAPRPLPRPVYPTNAPITTARPKISKGKIVLITAVLLVAVVIIAAAAASMPLRGEPAGMATRAPADMMPTIQEMGMDWQQGATSSNDTSASIDFQSYNGISYDAVFFSVEVHDTIEAARSTYDAMLLEISMVHATKDLGLGDACVFTKEAMAGSGSALFVYTVVFIKGNVLATVHVLGMDHELTDGEIKSLAAALDARIV